MINSKTVGEFKKFIKKNNTFLILSHINPEPDAIGSALSFFHYLKSLNKTVVVYNPDGVPKFMKFMPYSGIVIKKPPLHNFDAAISVDASGIDMLGDKFNMLKKSALANIDHHKTNTAFGDLNIVEPCASATCELIYVLFRKAGVPIDAATASLLLAGIIYDTGSFKYRNTTAKTLKISSELVKSGADIAGISEKLYENQPLNKLKLLEIILNKFQLSPNGKIASVEVTKSMYKATGTTKEDTEGMIDYPKSINGVIVAVLFREIDKNKYKISLRSKNDLDVSDIAKEFGGGGHRNAAGCTITGRLVDIKNKVFSVIEERLEH